jgi:hypothetical protein
LFWLSNGAGSAIYFTFSVVCFIHNTVLLGMAQNLLVGVSITTLPQNNSSFGDALIYVVTGGNGH